MICQYIAIENPCFLAENEVFGRFFLRNFTLFAQGLHLCQPRYSVENGDFLPRSSEVREWENSYWGRMKGN
jgi:hypothetical protein